MTFPDFLIIGAPKAGSTALHAALSRHPQLFLSPVKEPKYFLCDGRPAPQKGPGDAHSAQEWIWRREDYERLFDDAQPGRLLGESTPFYLYDREAHHRIHRELPGVKMLAVLRDPVDRAYSNWTHLWSDGLERRSSFLDACTEEPARAADGWGPFWRYLELGRYGEQLEHLYSHFDPEQVLLLRYRDLIDEPQDTLDRACAFLGVEPGLISNVSSTNVSTWVEPTTLNYGLQSLVRAGASVGGRLPPKLWRQASRPLLAALHRRALDRPPLLPEQRAMLVERFRDDVMLLNRLTGSDYSDWLAPKDRGTYSLRKELAPSALGAS